MDLHCFLPSEPMHIVLAVAGGQFDLTSRRQGFTVLHISRIRSN